MCELLRLGDVQTGPRAWLSVPFCPACVVAYRCQYVMLLCRRYTGSPSSFLRRCSASDCSWPHQARSFRRKSLTRLLMRPIMTPSLAWAVDRWAPTGISGQYQVRSQGASSEKILNSMPKIKRSRQGEVPPPTRLFQELRYTLLPAQRRRQSLAA